MDLCWRTIVKALVWPFVVIEREIVSQAYLQLGNSAVVLQVDVFVLDAPPERVPIGRDETVVEGTPASIHADLDVGVFQTTGKCEYSCEDQ